MEKHRPSPPPKEKETLEHTVTIIGSLRKVKLEKNKRASDLLKTVRFQFKKELENFPFNSRTNVVLNGRTIKMSDKGELEEDPILTTVSTLSLVPQISGGNN